MTPFGWPSAHYGKIRSLLLGLGWHEDPAAPEPQPFLSPDQRHCVMFEGKRWRLAVEQDWEYLVEIGWGETRDELLRALEEHGLIPIEDQVEDVLSRFKLALEG